MHPICWVAINSIVGGKSPCFTILIHKAGQEDESAKWWGVSSSVGELCASYLEDRSNVRTSRALTSEEASYVWPPAEKE